MSTVCLNCKKESNSIVELLCDHAMCLECAQKIKVAQGLPPLDAKFRICCPTCKRNTTTINPQNLINHNQERLLFVNMESSQLSEQELEQPLDAKGKLSESKLRKMSYTERRNNVYAERKTPQVAERSSKASHQSGRGTNRSRAGESVFEVRCNQHKQALMFYCEQQGMVMCMQCMYKHMKEQRNHNVCSISDAVSAIAVQNKEFKAQARRKMEQVDKCLTICKGNKTRTDQAYEIHQQLIQQEFRELQRLIKKKQAQNRQYLQKTFKKKQQEIAGQISELNYIKSCLKEHYEFGLESPNSQIYFFNAYSLLRLAVNKYSLNYKQIKKEDFFCFDKLTSIQDFSALLEKFFRPKAEGRDSKAKVREESNNPSRASDRGTQIKIKQQFYDEAKRKLQMLNRMEDEHNRQGKGKNRGEEYLNNFFIQSKKQLQNSSYNDKVGNSGVVTYRKSSASQYANDKKVTQKALTPTRMSTVNSKKKK